MKVRLPLPPHMLDLPEGSVTAFKGQWLTRSGEHVVGEVPDSLFDLWRARFRAEPVPSDMPVVSRLDSNKIEAVEDENGITAEPVTDEPALEDGEAPKPKKKSRKKEPADDLDNDPERS